MDGLPVFLCKHTADMENRALSCVCGRPAAHGDLQCFGLPCQGQAHHQLEPVVPDPGVQGAAVALCDLPHTGEAESRGRSCPPWWWQGPAATAPPRAFSTRSMKSPLSGPGTGRIRFVRPPGAAASMALSRALPSRAVQVQVGHRQLLRGRKPRRSPRRRPACSHGLRLGGEDGIGRVVFTDAVGFPAGPGNRRALVQIAESAPCSSPCSSRPRTTVR